jgi:hypothetical protein
LSVEVHVLLTVRSTTGRIRLTNNATNPIIQTPAAPEDDELVWLLAQLALDEAQQVLLVHARAVVDVRVNLELRFSGHKPQSKME